MQVVTAIFPSRFADVHRDREPHLPVYTAPKGKWKALYRTQIFSPSWMGVSIIRTIYPNLFSGIFFSVLENFAKKISNISFIIKIS